MTKAFRLLPAVLAAATLVGVPLHSAAQDAKEGERKAAMCIGCHGIVGYQASFPEVHHVPMIAGQGAGYIASALNAYRKGDRKHPTMRAIAGSLSDKDIADLAAYYQALGASSVKTVSAAPAPSAEVDALIKKGACTSCHGADFNKPIDPSYPKLAGEPGDYLYVALKAYKTEGNPIIGRSHPIMGAQVKPFSLAELKAIAAYVSTLPGDVRTVPESRFR